MEQKIDLEKMRRTRDQHVTSARNSFRKAAAVVKMPDELIERFWKMAFDAGRSDGIYESTKNMFQGMTMAKAQAAVAIEQGKQAEKSGPN